MLNQDGYLRRWSELHEGIDPAAVPFVRWWLGIAYVVGRPLAAARVSPTALTFTGLALAWAAVPVAGLGGRWPLAASALVVGSGLVDSLDGTVAVLSGRVSGWGALADAVCDRLADAAYAVAFWTLGAPAWLCLLWAVLCFLAEYARARGQALLGSPVDVVTVGERPTRVVVAAVFLALAAAAPASARVLVTVGVAAGAGAAAVGLVQLTAALRRKLR